MSEHHRRVLNLGSAPGKDANRFTALGVREVLHEHKHAGHPIAVWDWERNRVVAVPPQQIWGAGGR